MLDRSRRLVLLYLSEYTSESDALIVAKLPDRPEDGARLTHVATVASVRGEPYFTYLGWEDYPSIPEVVLGEQHYYVLPPDLDHGCVLALEPDDWKLIELAKLQLRPPSNTFDYRCVVTPKLYAFVETETGDREPWKYTVTVYAFKGDIRNDPLCIERKGSEGTKKTGRTKLPVPVPVAPIARRRPSSTPPRV